MRSTFVIGCESRFFRISSSVRPERRRFGVIEIPDRAPEAEPPVMTGAGRVGAVPRRRVVVVRGTPWFLVGNGRMGVAVEGWIERGLVAGSNWGCRW